MIRALLLTACCLWPALVSADAVAIIQQGGVDEQTGIYTPTITAAGAGHTIVIAAYRRGGGDSTWVASDPTNGAYDLNYEHVGYGAGSGRELVLLSKRGVAGGFTSITLDPSDETTVFEVRYWELSNVDSAGAVAEDDTGGQTANGTSQICGQTGLTGTGFFLGFAIFSTFATNTTAGSGYTIDGDATTTPGIIQRQIATLTANQAPYTMADSNQTFGAMFLFAEANPTEEPRRWLRRRSE